MILSPFVKVIVYLFTTWWRHRSTVLPYVDQLVSYNTMSRINYDVKNSESSKIAKVHRKCSLHPTMQRCGHMSSLVCHAARLRKRDHEWAWDVYSYVWRLPQWFFREYAKPRCTNPQKKKVCYIIAWFLVTVQLDAQILFNIFIYL